MKTYSPKVAELTREWLVIDAEGLVLGRVATVAASLLRGKHRTYFAPHADTGDFVIIVNADKVVVTANKLAQNFRYHHSGYPGGLRSTSWQTLMDANPVKLVERGRAWHGPQELVSVARRWTSCSSTPGLSTRTRPSSPRVLTPRRSAAVKEQR